MDTIGDEFFNQTKYKKENMVGGRLNWTHQPKLYKTYLDCPQITLPGPENDRSLKLNEILEWRKSIRFFNKQPLSIKDLSYLLWASTGIQRIQQQWEFRTAPSAGALYPIETYIIINNVESLEPGLYHYSIQLHNLEQLKIQVLGEQAADIALSQEMVAESSAIFVWTAMFERSKWKYKQRAYRYVFLDAGHIAAQFSLAAVDLGLGSCQIGAFYDNELNQLLGIDGIQESAIYMSVVGHYNIKTMGT
jgi:SagB-type dehydrogenase family enzyme